MGKHIGEKNRTIRLSIIFIVMLCAGFIYLCFDFSTEKDDVFKVHAAGSYSFVLDNQKVSDGETVELKYTIDNYFNVTIKPSSGEVIPDEITFVWTTNDTHKDIVEILDSSDNTGNSIDLKIKSPGYVTLYVEVKDANQTILEKNYCVIHIPLKWDLTGNLEAKSPDQYGLIQAAEDGFDEKGEPILTLQLYAENSVFYEKYPELKNSSILLEHPEFAHYLRKVKYGTYSYVSGSSVVQTYVIPTDSVQSCVTKDDLNDYPKSLVWTSSNPNIVSVDPDTGIVTALSAGSATIRATLSQTGFVPEFIEYNVVVVPEGKVIDGEELQGGGLKTVVKYPVDKSDIVIATNANNASDFDWRVKKQGIEITDELIFEGGNITISNVTAGVYSVIAIPKRISTGSNSKYNFDSTVVPYISALKYDIIVPIDYPPKEKSLYCYSDEFCESYNVLSDSNIPTGVFKFDISYEDQQIVKKGNSEELIIAKKEGTATVEIKKIDTEFNKLFGEYASWATPAEADDTVDPTGYAENQTIKVNVYGGALLNSSVAYLYVGGKLQLEVAAPNPFRGTVRWTSSNPNIADVDFYTGLVLAKAESSQPVFITATLTDGEITRQAQCKITVNSSANRIALEADFDSVNAGTSDGPIRAIINPESAPATSLIWKVSDNQIAEIHPAGDNLTASIEGRQPGTVVVTVSNPDNGEVGTMVVTITPVFDKISFTRQTYTVSKSSQPFQLFVNGYIRNTSELLSNNALIWESSDNNIATVDENGIVTLGERSGQVVISAKTQGRTNQKSALCYITVLQNMVTLTLENNIVLSVGEKHRIDREISPSNVSNSNLIWTSSDTNVVIVDENSGLITAKNSGTSTITAKSTDGSGLVATCLVTVVENATSVEIGVKEVYLNVGEVYYLDATVKPKNAASSLYFESGNSNIALVDRTSGKITAKSKGSCVIFAKTGSGKYDYCYVNVSQQVTGLELDREEVELHIGEMIELVAEVTPKSASDVELEWTSKNEKVATVSQKGVVKGVSKGATIISCTTLDGEYVAICLVTVVEGNRVVTVTVNKSAVVGVGKTYQLTATVDGEEVPANSLKWKSSNKKICKVTKNGVLKGVKTGKCKITVSMKDGSTGSAKCTVKVITATNDIELNKSYVEIVQGRTLKLKATTSPKKTTYSPLWESSDETIATVSKKGTITALKPGDCTIKCVAKDNSEVYAICRVHVTAPVNITSFNFSEEALVMVPGETSNIQYTVSPSNYTEGYTWSSDNPVAATVDSNGKVTARAVGSAKITALSNSGKKNTMNVYVVGLSKTKITLHQYESTKINLEVDGVKTGELDIRWDTDNQSIAEMSKGKVTGKALGTTTVYCVVNGRYLACTVKVIKN